MRFAAISIFTVVVPLAVTGFHIPAAHKAPVRSKNFELFAEANGSAESKKVIVLGGDGFCGWPTSLYLSDQGHDVVIVDNLSRRNIDTELGCDSLTPISSPEVRPIALACPETIVIGLSGISFLDYLTKLPLRKIDM